MCFAKNKLAESQCNSVCDASLMEVSSVQEEVEKASEEIERTKDQAATAIEASRRKAEHAEQEIRVRSILTTNKLV